MPKKQKEEFVAAKDSGTNKPWKKKTIDCFVYNVSQCGFSKNELETISSITITTPNGSVTYDASV